MPIAVNYADDFAVHEEADTWTTYQIGDDGPWMAQLCNQDGQPIGVDLVISNIVQIQHLSDEEFEEIAELL